MPSPKYPLADAITEAFSLPSVEENFPADLIPQAELNPFLVPTEAEWNEMIDVELERDLGALPSPSWLDRRASAWE